MIEITDKVYDADDSGDDVELRCRKCGLTNTLVEYTMVPRHMGANVLRMDDGSLVVSLNTADDDAFWEGETGHKWACRTCLAEGDEVGDVFEILAAPEVAP